MIGIYKIISPSNKVYIGQSINIEKRKKYYTYVVNNIGQPSLYNSLLKYGFDNHKFEVIEECSLEQLNERETYWKQVELDKVNNDWSKVLFCGLYDKGGGPKSKQWKENIGLANSKPKPEGFMSNELKQKIQQSRTGIKHKTHKSHSDHKSYNKPKPEGFKELLSSILKGKQTKPRIPIIQLNKNGDILQEYDSYTTAEKYTNIKGIANVLTGRAKTAGGYVWKYKEILD